MDGIWVFLGAGAGIGGLVGLALCTPGPEIVKANLENYLRLSHAGFTKA